MKKRIKRAFSTFMIVVLTLTVAPLSGLVGINVPNLIDTSIVAEAATQYNLYWPVPTSAAAIGRISSAFGPRKSPTTGASTNHRGIDIPVGSGTSVYAAYDGVVVAIGKTNARGNYVLLYHSSIGLSTLYQHLTCATVQKGDTVSGGSQIALSGNTGIGTGAHLHYGVMVGKATKVDNDQPSYNMAINPLGSNISYSSSTGKIVSSDNPDDYTYPTRDLFYTSPVKTGNDVKWVQAVLWRLGYDISIDGSFGPATRDVVKQFQADYGLDVDGSCGPATRSKLLELWNKKKNGNINITLHAWLSNEAYGDVPDKFISRDRVYLCYELVDSDTWQKINSLVDKNYTAKVTLYNPDGSVHYTASFDNDDASWISIVPKQAGLYRGTVEVTGEVVRTVNVSFGLEYDPTIDLSKSSLNLNLNGTNTTTINITFGGGLPGEYRIRWQDANSVVSGSWGEWDGMTIPLTVTGLKRGTSELKIMVLEDYTGNLTPVKTVSIPVTVTANSYTISYNANGGSGAPASQTKYYGTDITLSSTVPTRFGYTFLGWSTSSSATSATYLPGANFSGNSNTTLYAVWKAATTLSIGTTYSAGISFANKEIYYTFTPSSSGNFTFKSTGSLDSQVYIYNSSGTLIESNDDIGDTDRNFSLSLDLTGGTKYYVKVKAYSDKTGTTSFNVTGKYTVNYNANGGSGAPSAQTKIHGTTLTLSSGKPTRTGYTFTGWNTKADGTGTNYSAGGSYTANTGVTLYAVWKANPINLTVNSSNNATISTGNEMKYYTFTPGESGTYVIYSTGSVDTKVYLYNSSGTELTNDDDGGTDRNFRLQYNLTAGTTYKFGIKFYSSTTTGTIPFKFGKVYTVTYNANGGSGAPSSQTKDYGAALTLSSTIPTRTGYTFLGWSTSSTATSATYSAGGTYSSESNVTLYAVWKANPVNLTVNSSNNATISTGGEIKYYTFTPSETGAYVIYSTGSVDTKVYLYNSSGTELANDDDGGDGTNFRLQYNLVEGTTYRFGVRYYNSSNTGTIPFKFGKVYTITYNANGGGGAPSSQTKDYGTALTLSSTAPTRTGYTFLGWSTSSTATSAAYTAGGTYSSESNVTLYAVWKANTYSVKYNANGGSGTMSNSAHTYDVSKTLTSNAFTRSGYTFLGWSTSSSATTVTYTNSQSVKNLSSVNGDTVNLYAVWSKIPTYTISYNANGGSNAPSSQTKTKDVKLTLSSTKPTKSYTINFFANGGTVSMSSITLNFTFNGWNTNANGSGTSYASGGSYTNNESATLYAQWKAPSACVLPTPNRTGYTFLGWSTISTATSATYPPGSTYNLCVDVNLYAVWSKIPTYTISYNANGGSNAPSSQTKTKDVALTLSSTKPTRTGYTFLGWSTSSTATTATYQAGGSFTANADTVLYAIWKANTYTVKYNANGGSGSMSSSSHTYDVSKALTSNAFTRSGYSFLGWSKDSSATTATYTNSQSVKNLTSVNGDTVNLYAVWHKHSYTSKVTTAATCTAAGIRTYTCSGCSDSYTETIAKLGHNYSTSYTVDTPATCTTAGSKSQHCTRCTAKQNVTVIPATGHNYVNGTCSSCGKTNVTTSAAITVSSASVSAGNQVKVIISLKNNPGITSMLLSVNYDESKLQLVKVEDCENLGSAFHSNVLSSPFTLSWANDTATSNYTYNGDIVVLTFKVKDDAEVGATPITVTYEYNNYDIIDKDMNRVEFNVENGSVNISDVLIGDVNNDGNVNTLDRVILTRYIAKWAEYPAESINMVAADVNCDGSVNTLDRVILTRYIAHWGGYESLPYNN